MQTYLGAYFLCQVFPERKELISAISAASKSLILIILLFDLIYIWKQTFLLPATLQLSLSLFQSEIIKLCQHYSCIARPLFFQNCLFQSTTDKEVQSHQRLCWISSHHQKTYPPIKAFPVNTVDLEYRF